MNPDAATSTSPSVDALVKNFDPVSLEEINDVASLLARVDRKYLVSFDQLVALLGTQTNSLVVLEIDGRRIFEYRSTYFDTADLQSYRSTAHSTRKRFKVRAREYLDDGTKFLEVKTRGGRGETVKVRRASADPDITRFGEDSLVFLRDVIGPEVDISTLGPTATTAYRRVTFLERSTNSRVTVDVNPVFSDVGGFDRRFDDLAFVETKSTGGLTGVDRSLWSSGVRPVRVSKYGIAMALANDSLSANKWNRVLRRHFGWIPAQR
jgi:VTC domain